MSGHLALLKDFLAALLANLCLELAHTHVITHEMPCCDEVTALVGAGNGTELALVSMMLQLTHFENAFATISPILALYEDLLYHVAHYAVYILNLKDAIAAVGALMLPCLPDVHALSAETALARRL